MSETCEWCGSERIEPVLDKRIEQAPTAGNKYRTRCLGCWRWHPMTSTEAWESSSHQYVLPADADPEIEDNLVPRSEYGTPEKAQELAEKVDAQGVEQYVENNQAVATDGGADLDEADDLDGEDDADDADDEEENDFVCPANGCEIEHVGYPERCSCGATYDWSEAEEDE